MVALIGIEVILAVRKISLGKKRYASISAGLDDIH